MNDIHDDFGDIIFVFVVFLLMALLILSSWESGSGVDNQVDSAERTLEFYKNKICEKQDEMCILVAKQAKKRKQKS